jgi:AraC family transcriptional regulator
MKDIRIKNMVCPRCISAVEQKLELLKIPYKAVHLGKVELNQPMKGEELNQLELELRTLGFVILQDKDSKLIESTKLLLNDLISAEDIPPGFSLINFLKEKLGHDYAALSNLFSSTKV